MQLETPYTHATRYMLQAITAQSCRPDEGPLRLLATRNLQPIGVLIRTEVGNVSLPDETVSPVSWAVWFSGAKCSTKEYA